MAEKSLLALRLIAAAALLALVATSAGAAPKDKALQWAALTADQQQVLAPLAADWKKLSREQKIKWLGIAKRYPKMTPIGQKRVQTRMEKWVKLTPEQRWQARERYRNIGKFAPDRRDVLRRQWAEYQSLPPHEKRMFDVPPNYVPPAERRKRAKRPKQPTPAYNTYP
ncbi:MAG: DUF3106 domain-containing protein [Betaproteobacteria bacterium]|nr:DUF3106 domain-containing protein [Betaproteobacteria bacterium]